MQIQAYEHIILDYFCLIKANKMHFSFLIYFNNLSSTCFELSNYSPSGDSYCICSLWYLPCWKY